MLRVGLSNLGDVDLPDIINRLGNIGDLVDWSDRLFGLFGSLRFLQTGDAMYFHCVRGKLLQRDTLRNFAPFSLKFFRLNATLPSDLIALS